MEKEAPGIRDEALFVAVMKRTRESLGISQGELASRLNDAGWEGFRQATVSRIEKGERSIRLAEAHAIAESLGLPFRRMMDETAREHTTAYAQRIREIDDLLANFTKQIAEHQQKLAALHRMTARYKDEKEQLEAALEGRTPPSPGATLAALLVSSPQKEVEHDGVDHEAR